MNESRELVAWAAGWFEGEGSICGKGRSALRIGATNTDLDVLERFKMIVECGGIYKRPDVANRKPKWDWAASSHDALVVLEAFLPYFGARRRARAEERIKVRRAFEEWMAEPRACAVCGKDFIAGRYNQMFCGRDCRRLALNQRQLRVYHRRMASMYTTSRPRDRV